MVLRNGGPRKRTAFNKVQDWFSFCFRPTGERGIEKKEDGVASRTTKGTETENGGSANGSVNSSWECMHRTVRTTSTAELVVAALDSVVMERENFACVRDRRARPVMNVSAGSEDRRTQWAMM